MSKSSRPKYVLCVLALAAPAALPGADAPGVKSIIQMSVDASNRDWKAQPDYDRYERDTHPQTGDSKTYHVLMIEGSPYKVLVTVNGEPLSRDKQRQEQKKLERERIRRRNESAHQRKNRIKDYEQGRERDHQMLLAMTKALDFTLRGIGSMDGHKVYILDAKPRPGYQPTSMHTKALTGMDGTLWIDRNTYQWVKAEANVVHPVSIAGFLAEVEPGTRFELEKEKVGDGIWLPRHFQMKSKAKILGIFDRKESDEETWFDYRRAK